jgi:serine protease
MPTSGSPENNRKSRRRVVVKFRDATILPYEDGAERHVARLGIGPWQELAERFKGIRLDRLFTVASPERIGTFVFQATDRDRRYRAPNLLSYFVIDCPAGLDTEALAAALRGWAQVETAYVDPLDESPAPPSSNPDYAGGLQRYLRAPAIAPPPAPQGAIDAEFAWTQPGGTGAMQKIVDLERGAKLDHEDLLARNIQTLHGINAVPDRPHGARVLGVVAAVDNTRGGIGIAYDLDEVAYTCQVLAGGVVDRPNAVMAAIEHFTQPGEDPVGRVLLLEVQLNPLTGAGGTVWNWMPMETALADFEVIRLATALGMIVVEPTGNGSNNLDAFQEASGGKFVLSRNHPGDFKDSGAIMVGGSTSDFPYTPLAIGPGQGTGFGSRVDCFAWAENVRTCDVDPFTGQDTYTSTFGGTSSAAAIVAGAVLLVQGVAQASSMARRLSPGEMRALLSDPAINTHSANYGVDQIGVMPNLRRVLQDALGLAPDVYMRDYVGDTGAVHAGAISLSPDIIVRPAPEAAPDVTFGPGTEDDLSLGQTATAGQDNFVYVRVWNRGAVAASNVTATVFYSPASTLLTPVDWKPVGSVILATVPPANVMTVSAAITWPKSAVPAPGHYCFIALVGNAQDPAPDPATFLSFDNYYAYIRNNNNVTWRNFDVVTAPAPGDPGDPGVRNALRYAFEFVAPGAADADRYFELSVGSRLPSGSRVWLETPVSLVRDRLPSVDVDEEHQTGRVPIGAHGRTTLPPVMLPTKSRSRCHLLVEVPGEYREDEYEVYVSQLYKDFEVGRVTWRIAPRQ